MDRLDTMSVFLAVVEAGSLSAAGRQLGMPLATVSRKLAQLESHLDARLLSRSTRALDLTEAGRAYVDACKRILGDVADAERAAGGEYNAPRGELAITAPIVFGRLHVLPVVAEFLQAYPAVDIRLALSDRNAHLLDEHVDLAVRIGALPDSRLNARPLGTLRRVVCASPGYWKTHGKPKTPADLARHACVTFDLGGAPDVWTLRASKRDDAATTPIAVRSRLAVNTAEAAVDAAVANHAVDYLDHADLTRYSQLYAKQHFFERAIWETLQSGSTRNLADLSLAVDTSTADPRIALEILNWRSKTLKVIDSDLAQLDAAMKDAAPAKP